MKTALTIKDLALDSELDSKEMAAVRGGNSDQANGTSQLNGLASMTASNIANGTLFANCAPVIIQADTDVQQHGDNYSDSSNGKLALAWLDR